MRTANVRFLYAALILLSLSCLGASVRTAETRVESTERNFQARERLAPLGDGLTGRPERAVSRSDDNSGALTSNNAISTARGLQPQTSNPIDDAEFFVRQHYIDFLNRQPDPSGLAYWTNEITRCGNDATCINERRIGVSGAFFVEAEFRQTGFFIYRVYKASLGLQPTYNQYFIDRNTNALDSQAGLTAYTEAFVQRQEFLQKYPDTATGVQFVAALLATVQQSSGTDLTAKQAELVLEYGMGSTQTESRARVLRKLIEYPEYVQAEYNPAFVQAEYFGYLRRNPDPGGYAFWLDVLNNRDPNNYRGMVFAFITSIEYRSRFGTQEITIEPNQGQASVRVPVLINGQFTNFYPQVTQASFGAGISVGGGPEGGLGPVTVISKTTATAELLISDTATLGSRTVTVRTGGELLTLGNGFTVLARPAFSVQPDTGRQGQSLAIAIQGQNTHFLQGTTEVNFGPGITVGQITVSSSTTLTVQLMIAPDATVGTRAVTIRTGVEEPVSPNGFFVQAEHPEANTATLTVRTFLPSDVSPDGISEPGPAGVIIFIDNSEFGITGADGTATLQVPASTLQVEARLYPSNSGQAEVTLALNETKQVDIILEDGKELTENSTLNIEQIVEGILDHDFTALTLRLTKDDGATVALQSVDLIALLDPEGGASTFVTQMFTLQPDGTLALNNVASFRSLLLAQTSKILLNVSGEDTQGRIHDRTAEFSVSAYKITGHLSAPPSKPSLNTAGIPITGRILNTNLVFNVVSDASGNFEFPLLPPGNFEFSSATLQNGLYYYGQGILVLNGNKSLNVNMLGTVDLVNGVIPFTVSPLAAQNSSAEADPAERERREALASQKNFAANSFTSDAVTPLTDPTTVSVNVTANQQNTPVTQTATLTVPQGTKTVDLTYTVQTDEYPTYVLAHSIYNDTWSVVVRAGTAGQQLCNFDRQINSQLTVAPVWQSNGSTGAIKQTLNVESLTVNGSTSLVLFASAMNVGDSILPTRVSATLGPDAGVKINNATPDSTVPLNFHSIPRPGAKNEFDRCFTLDISKPDMSTVKKLTVTLLGPGPLMTVVDEAPGGDAVKAIDEHTLRVKVSIKTPASTVNSQPPPAYQLKYRFKLVVDVNGTEVSDEKESGERRGLWRMPDGFARFSPSSGPRDKGGDDWCSRGTYNWLVTNRSLITKINDISGEHGRYIGHDTHRHGTDIDMFHLYTFPGAVSGGSNYTKLVADVKLAINTGSSDPVLAAQAAAAKQRVTAWVTATHTGLDALAANATVIELRYALGMKTTGLSEGWARNLLKTGKTTVSGQMLDLGTGTWNNSKYIAVNNHNDHIHITLSRPALEESN